MRLLSSCARLAREAAGWLLVAALFYAPWDEGGTSASAIRNLNWILGAMFALWWVGTLLVRRGGGFSENSKVGDSGFNRSSWLLLGCALLLLILGWGIALNAHAVFDADFLTFLPVRAPRPGMSGSVDYFLSVAFMWRATTLLGCIWVMAQLAQDGKWLLRIWWAIGLAGASIALLGLVQKATGAELPFWAAVEEGEGAVTTFFASFYYHGNAGAYLNLALPAVLGLAGRYIYRPNNPGARALWIALSVLMIVAVVSDTSRMGQLIAMLMSLSLIVLSARKTLRKVRYLDLKTALVALLVGGVAFWAVVRTSHLDRSFGRWEQFQATWEHDARWAVDKVAINAFPQAGALGFGPGTFSAFFPTLLNGADPNAQGSWLFLHDDYLQTLLEWGWVGSVLWATVFFGGMLLALVSLASERHSLWLPRQRALLQLSLIALAGVAIHAAVDFPLQIASIQLYAATYLGICWGSGNWGRARPKVRLEELES